ncbi:MAG: VWA domain-containing protein [Calditrichaeota bacterium]|nr:VWA domain-containing protein [Calditrichota bacterium]
MESFSLTFSESVFLFILLAILSVGYSIYVYRRTNPPAPRWLRILLTSLRALALLLIAFLIFEPLLNISYIRKEAPVVAVLLDQSASMSLGDHAESRGEAAKKILRDPLFRENSSKIQFDYFGFSVNLTPFGTDTLDSLQFTGEATNLTEAIRKISEQYVDKNLQALILLSDGIFNSGENPNRIAEDLGLPIFPISVGEPTEQKDIVVSNILTNQVTYVKNRVPADVTIFARGFDRQKIKVNLFDGKKLIDSKTIRVGNPPETKLRLYFTPEKEGLRKYVVQTPALKNELTELNNSKSFYVKVLKSKMKILYLCGGPDPDFSFIKRVLQADPNTQVDYFIAKKGAGFYQNKSFPPSDSLKKYDLFVLHNFPPRKYKTAAVAQIQQFLKHASTPLMLIWGNGINDFMLASLSPYLPMKLPLNRSKEQATLVKLSEAGKTHPVTQIADNEFENQKIWDELPPVYYSFNSAKINPGASVLLTAEKKSIFQLNRRTKPIPLLLTQKLGQQKSLALLAYGVWRWDLLMWGIGKDNRAFRQLLNNSIRWLVNKEDTKIVRIYPTQEIFHGGQAVSFAAQIYTPNYDPLDGADVRVQVRDSLGREFSVQLNPVGEGKYEASLEPLPGGDYSYRGIASFQNRQLGTDRGQFSVEDFNLEFLETKINQAALQQLAFKTHGEFIADSALSLLKEKLNFQTREIRVSRQWQLWHQLIFLIIAVVLLAVEWFLRKKFGML